MSLFQELKRRNVLRVAVLYVIAAWLVLQIADVAISLLELPSWSGKLVFMLVALGFIPALLFSWLYELTPDGLKRDQDVNRDESITPSTGRKIDALIGIFGALAVIAIVFDRLIPETPLAPDASSPAGMVAPDSAESVPNANAPAAVVDDKSIAVLPFVNMSEDESQDYFSDGISEELLNVLAQIKGLRVAARTSSFQFKGQNTDIGEIARTLGVAHVLEGSVRKSGQQVRITAQLIKAADGFHLWSSTYDRELIDIFAIQDEIANAVADELQARLGLGDNGQNATRPEIIEAANAQAYEAYLHGRQLINRRGKDNLEEAVKQLERSIRLDSNYAPAHAQLVIATALLLRSPSTYGELSLAEVVKRATPHVERALLLAPNLAETHGAATVLALQQRAFSTVIKHSEEALRINPSYIDAWNWQFNALGEMGEYRDYLHSSDEMVRLDPKSVIGRMNRIPLLIATKRSKEGRELARELAKTHPWAGNVALALTQIEDLGELSDGIELGLKAHALEPSDQLGNSILAFAFGWLDLYPEARRISDSVAYGASFGARRYAEAIGHVRASIAQDPDNSELLYQLAAALYRSGQPLLARTNYEDLLKSAAPLKLLIDPLKSDAIPMLRLAHTRRLAGEANSAATAIELVAADVTARRDAGFETHSMALTESMLAALRGDSAAAAASLRRAIDLGLRDSGVFDEALFDTIKKKPGVRQDRSRPQRNSRERTSADAANNLSQQPGAERVATVTGNLSKRESGRRLMPGCEPCRKTAGLPAASTSTDT